jgi:hypothetical protein
MCLRDRPESPKCINQAPGKGLFGPLNTIRALLGHVWLAATNQYAAVEWTWLRSAAEAREESLLALEESLLALGFVRYRDVGPEVADEFRSRSHLSLPADYLAFLAHREPPVMPLVYRFTRAREEWEGCVGEFHNVAPPRRCLVRPRRAGDPSGIRATPPAGANTGRHALAAGGRK